MMPGTYKVMNTFFKNDMISSLIAKIAAVTSVSLERTADLLMGTPNSLDWCLVHGRSSDE